MAVESPARTNPPDHAQQERQDKPHRFAHRVDMPKAPGSGLLVFSADQYPKMGLENGKMKSGIVARDKADKAAGLSVGFP